MKDLTRVTLLVFAVSFSASQLASQTLQDLHAQNPSSPSGFTGSITTIHGQTGVQNGLPPVSNIAVSGENVHSLITFSGSSSTRPLVLVHVVGWFCPLPTGNSCDGHVILTRNTAYDDHSLAHIQANIAEMRRRGVDGVTVLWKGPTFADGSQHFLDKTVQLYLQAADQLCNGAVCPFHVAVMDSMGADYYPVCSNTSDPACKCSASTNPTCTTVYKNHLNYIYSNYIVPHASALKASDGRPIMPNYDLPQNYPSITSANVATVHSSLSFNPYLIFDWQGSATPTGSYVGYFEWVHPRYSPILEGTTDQNRANDPNIAATADNPKSLDGFYNSFPGTQNFAAAYAGFDDAPADWGKSRKMNRKCGKTWLDTMAEVNNKFSSTKPLDFIQLESWDDYEEGHELETGISNCLTSITGSVTGDTLNLNVTFGAQPNDMVPLAGDSGSHRSIRRYDVYYTTQNPANATSDDQVDLTFAGSQDDTDTGVTSINLASGSFSIPPGQSWLFVNAVGKPFIQNHVNSRANAIPYSKSGSVGWAPTTYNFGTVFVGQTSSPQQFSLTNTTASTLTSLAFSTTGPFTESAGSTSPCGTTLASGATCNVNVSFSPTTTGAASGTLTATSNGGNATSSLSGTGQQQTSGTTQTWTNPSANQKVFVGTNGVDAVVTSNVSIHVVQLYVNGVKKVEQVNDTTTAYLDKTFSITDPGTYTVSVQALDSANNVLSHETRTVTAVAPSAYNNTEDVATKWNACDQCGGGGGGDPVAPTNLSTYLGHSQVIEFTTAGESNFQGTPAPQPCSPNCPYGTSYWYDDWGSQAPVQTVPNSQLDTLQMDFDVQVPTATSGHLQALEFEAQQRLAPADGGKIYNLGWQADYKGSGDFRTHQLGVGWQDSGIAISSFTANLLDGAWHHVTAEYHIDPANGDIYFDALTIDGQRQGVHQNNKHTPTTTTSYTQMTNAVKLDMDSTNTGTFAYFDNLNITYTY